MKKIHFSTPNTDAELKGFGIYAIRNSVNGKSYVGSVTSFSRFRDRWSEHRRTLLKNCHANGHLQNAWNKYGADKFTFNILEQCLSNDILLSREQFYIDRCGDEKYNLCPIAGNTLGTKQSSECVRKKSKEWVFVSPSNEIFNVVNMRMFCRKMNLPQSHLIAVARGVERHYKGWLSYPKDTVSDEQIQKDMISRRPLKYKIVSPNGNEFIVDNVRAFCRQHSLDHASLFHCLTNRNGLTNYKGWTMKRLDN